MKPRIQTSRETLIQLRLLLDGHFSDQELRTLCFDLGVDYDNLSGDTKEAKARELIAYLKRRKRIPDLLQVGQRSRPELDWPRFDQRQRVQVELILRATIDDWSDAEQSVVVRVLAAVLQVDPSDVQILQVQPVSSIKVSIELPWYTLEQFNWLSLADKFRLVRLGVRTIESGNLGTINLLPEWWPRDGGLPSIMEVSLYVALAFLALCLFGVFGYPAIRQIASQVIATPIAALTFTPTPTRSPILSRTSTATPLPTPSQSPSPSATTIPSVMPSPTPTPTPDPKPTLMALIEAEKQAALTKNMDLIQSIFDPNATKTDPAEHQSWNAIQRYAETFQTEDYSKITHTNFEFDIADNKAIVTNDSCGSFTSKTKRQGIEINCPQCDQWTFKRDTSGRWWITDFTYGLVSTAPSHQYNFEDGTTGCWVIRSDNNVLQGQTVISTTELAHQGQGSLRFAFDLAQVPAHRGQIIRNLMPFAGQASAYIYAPPDAPSDLVAGFFAMELDHAPWNYKAADQTVTLAPGKWTLVSWSVSAADWAQPLHLLGIEVRQAGGTHQGYVLIDDVVIKSR